MSPWANHSSDPGGGEALSSNSHCMALRYGALTSSLGTRSRVPELMADGFESDRPVQGVDRSYGGPRGFG